MYRNHTSRITNHSNIFVTKMIDGTLPFARQSHIDLIQDLKPHVYALSVRLLERTAIAIPNKHLPVIS